MPFFTVTEIWTNPATSVFLKHTNEFRIRLHFQLDDMEAAGDFVRNTITGDRSIYTSDGSPVKIFTNRGAVDSYHAWLCQEYKPYDLIIEEWPDMAAVTAYLHKVRAVDIDHDKGPTADDKRQWLQQRGFDPDDPACPRKIID